MCLTIGVVGVYSGAAPSLALVSELAAGPGLVVALPLYNSCACFRALCAAYGADQHACRWHTAWRLDDGVCRLCALWAPASDAVLPPPPLCTPAVGNVGGFLGPYLTGILLQQTHSFALPTILMGASMATAGVLFLLMPYVMRMPGPKGKAGLLLDD